MSRHKKYRIKLKSLYVWHRYIGLTVSALVILLALTGMLLNHTEQFELDRRFVHNAWILDWYGIKPPTQYTAYSTSLGTVALLDTRLFAQGKALTGDFQQLHGAIAINGMLAVAVDSGLLLLTPEGEIVEHLSATEGSPTDISSIGLTQDGHPVVAAKSGEFITDADFLNWQPVHNRGTGIVWASPIRLSAANEQVLAEKSREDILPYERVLLDLHSGRLFGHYGPLVMDGAALLMLFLAGSGLLIWLKRKRSKT